MKRPLTEQVQEILSDIVRECGPKYWTLDDDSQARATWGPPGVVTLTHQDTGHEAELRVDLAVTQLPPLGPEDDGALRAELAAGMVSDAPPPISLAEGEHPGPALLVRLVEVARSVAREPGYGLSNMFGPGAQLLSALEDLDLALQVEAEALGQPTAGHWEPATWSAVKGGDRVRLGTAEAVVTRASEVTAEWVGRGEHTACVAVMLEGRDGAFQMKPSGPVEIWRPAVADWAAHAFKMLSDAGLGPEVSGS